MRFLSIFQLFILKLTFFGLCLACGGGDDGGSDNRDGGGGGEEGHNNEEDEDTTSKDFDFENSGALSLSFGETASSLSNSSDFQAYTPEQPPIPAVAETVEAATPGQLVLNSFSLISCSSVESYNHAHWFGCKAINDGAAGYPNVLSEIDGRLNRINQIGSRGALCFEVDRSSITISENNLSISQELSCYDAFDDENSGDEGLAFGYSDSKVWTRLTDGYGIATIDIDANGDAENIEVWSIGSDSGKHQITHIKSTGSSTVEVTAAGSNLNAHYEKGVQVLMDKTNNMMYMRYICDAMIDSHCDNADVKYLEFCTDTDDNDLTNSVACPGTIPFTMSMLVLDDTVTGLPGDTTLITEADIPTIGDATDAAVKALMTTRIPDPIAAIRDIIYGTSSNSLASMLSSMDANLETTSGWITDDPSQCLVEVPSAIDISTPYDLDRPLYVSCSKSDETDWTVYGSANGSTYFMDSESDTKSLNMIAFHPEQGLDAWFLRPWVGVENNEQNIFHVKNSGDGTVEVAGMLEGDAFNCGVYYQTNGSYIYISSSFNADACTSSTAPASGDIITRCVDLSDLSYVAMSTCETAGLNIQTIPSLDPGDLSYANIVNLVPTSSPSLDASDDAVDTESVPPIAEIPLPDDGDGTVDIVPLRSVNKRLAKTSGGGLNYGRNCSHSSAVGDAAADAVYEYNLSSLSGAQLTSLNSQISAGEAFISFNFAEDTTIIGTGASASRDLTFKVELLDNSGEEIASKTYNNADLASATYIIFSVLNDQTLDGTEKLKASLSGTATVSCTGDSGQAHISAGISDLRLRF